MGLQSRWGGLRRQPSSRVWILIGAALVTSAMLLRFGPVWFEGPTLFVPETYVEGVERPLASDHIFTTWLVGRNARVLATSPWSFFDAEPCYPIEHSVALGEHGLGLGLLGIPGYLLTGDTVATYNSAIALSILAAAAAVAWLVFGWTGVPAAAIGAGLLYAFAVQRIVDLAHFFIVENLWTALALVFVERAFARGRWQDTLLAGACCALQLGSSLYTVVAALLLAPPMGIWLFLRHRTNHLRPWAVAAALAVIALAAYWIFTPYLEIRAGGDLLQKRAEQVFLQWEWLLPQGRLFQGYVPTLLALSALGMSRRKVFAPGRGDPRVPLVLGALLVLVVAAGGNSELPNLDGAGELPPENFWPNPYAWLAMIVPGLEVVRDPAAIQSGFVLVVSLLAGLGLAGWVRLLPTRHSTLTQLSALSVVWLAIVVGPQTGHFAGLEFHPLRIGPSNAMIAALGKLEAAGVEGPVIELPMNPESIRFAFVDNPRRVLLSNYHQLRTASCYNSFQPAAMQRAAQLAREVPAADALEELRALGFRTILVHHVRLDAEATHLGNTLNALARDPRRGLKVKMRSMVLSAFELVPPPGASSPIPGGPGA